MAHGNLITTHSRHCFTSDYVEYLANTRAFYEIPFRSRGDCIRANRVIVIPEATWYRLSALPILYLYLVFIPTWQC